METWKHVLGCLCAAIKHCSQLYKQRIWFRTQKGHLDIKSNKVHLDYLMKATPLFYSKQLFSCCGGKGSHRREPMLKGMLQEGLQLD